MNISRKDAKEHVQYLLSEFTDYLFERYEGNWRDHMTFDEYIYWLEVAERRED